MKEGEEELASLSRQTETGRWRLLLPRSLRSSPDPCATEEKATAVSSIGGKNDGSELIHRWRPAPEGTSLVSNNSLCLRNTLNVTIWS